MPELPEVESLRQMLADSVVGRRMVSVAVRERRLRRPLARDLASGLAQRRIERIERRAKYLLIYLSGGVTLLVHLGMSGSLTHRNDGFRDTDFNVRHDHVSFSLDDHSRLVFNDPRRFGLMKLVASDQVGSCVELRDLGPEPMGADFTPEYLAGKARGRRCAIKSLLMDQRVVAGIGNIYASEILFAAGVRPYRRAGRVTRAELARIVEATPRILAQAMDSGGTTFRSYRDSRGQPGKFAPRLKVYGREGQPCYACGSAIAARVVGQRASFYCPHCQR